MSPQRSTNAHLAISLLSVDYQQFDFLHQKDFLFPHSTLQEFVADFRRPRLQPYALALLVSVT